MDYAKESLAKHAQWRGKIQVVATVPVATKDDLSLAYTPGVAQPCLEIQKDVSLSYELTRRWNLCLVVTDGTAVLGLGDIGPEAGMPVMEGKCVLFKTFGDVDAFPLCIKSKDVDEIVNTILTSEPKTASDVAAELGVSAQKASALLRSIVANGQATVSDIKVPKKGTQKAYTLAE